MPQPHQPGALEIGWAFCAARVILRRLGAPVC